MTDVFISYARVDLAKVEKLATALEASGFSIWWDREIEGGSEFSKELEGKLNDAAVVLVCWSRASVNSMWVADEATVGRDKGCLVPIALEAVAPKLGFRQIQTIDFSVWSGGVSAAEYRQLERVLRTKLAHKNVPPDTGLTPPTPAIRPAGFGRAAFAEQWKTYLPSLAILAIAGLVGLAIFLAARPTNMAQKEKTIAILPFEVRSQRAGDYEYGDWLSELISSLLGKASGLVVISQNSASTFKGEDLALSEIARQLGVTLIVDGSVRSDGNAIVISAKLINVKTDSQIWADVYERNGDNALAVQSEVAARIAAEVASALKVSIGAGEERALNLQTSPVALEKYQEALKLYRTTQEANVRAAQRLLDETVEADPAFASAWALLSRVHSYFYFNSTDATESRRAAAARARDEALRLAPDLAEVLLADAYYEYWVKRDYEASSEKFRKLSAKWPNNTDVLTALASITRRLGRWDESKKYFERAVTIDPLRPGRRLHAAEVQFATRDFDGALRQLNSSLQYWPDAPENVRFIAKKAWVYQALGRLDEAGALLQGLELQPDGELVAPIVNQAILRRRHGDAIGVLEGLLTRDEAAGSAGRASIDLNLALGDLRRLNGDVKAAEINYRKALRELQSELERQPDSADIHSYLALAYCGLGDGAKATQHASAAVKILPLSVDALSGAYYMGVQARVWARLGHADAAIPAIKLLLSIPGYPPLTPAILQLDPDFDSLRSDPDFKKLLN